MDILEKQSQTYETASSRNQKKWSEPDKNRPGIIRMVNKYKLRIDGEYQRDAVSRRKVEEIAKNFDWRLFGALSVFFRDDYYYIYDGGHRARATFFHQEILEVPCVVFESCRISSEARMFIGANKMKSNVSALCIQKAACVAGDPLALDVKDALERNGYHMSKNYERYSFIAVGMLKQMLANNRNITMLAFDTCCDIADGECFSGGLLKGIYELINHFGPEAMNRENVEKLKKAGSRVLETAIRREQYIAGIGGGKVFATALLKIINHRKKYRLNW